MNLLEIRTRLRRQVQDPNAEQFSDAELTSLINEAYSAIQSIIYPVNKEAHIVWSTLPTTAGTSWYSLPPTFGVNAVKLKSKTTDTDWTLLKKKRLDDIELLNTGNQNHYYAKRGQWIGVFPAPDQSVSNGLLILNSPIMQLAADTDVPAIKQPLHMAILWLARIYAADEDETVDLSKVEARLNSLLASIPLWYDVDSDGADTLQVDLGIATRRGAVPNDLDVR